MNNTASAADVAPFRWAILGTGVVARKFVLGLRQCAHPATAIIVASRTASNATRMATELAIPEVAGSYEEAITHDAVDFVYIATPPTAHRDHALAAIAAGKPVLVEKPFATTGAEAEEIAGAARAAAVFCMEGMWTRFLPLLSVLRARLAAGAIGEVRGLDASFCSPVVEDPSHSLFDPARGGGALLHRGIYPLSLARDLLGPVSDVTSLGRLGATKVDEEVVVQLRHQSGALSTLRASIAAPGRNDLVLFGTTGALAVRAPIYRPWELAETRVQPARQPRPGDPRKEAIKEGSLAQGAQQRLGRLLPLLRRARPGRTVAHYEGNGYHYEADAVAADVAAGRHENAVMPLGQSVEIMHLIDRIRAGWA